MVYTLYHPFMVKLGMAYYWVCQNHTVFIHPRVHIPQTSPNRPLAAGTPADCKTPQARATSVNSARTSHQIDDEAKENHKFTLEHGNGRSPINVNEMGNIQDEMGKYVYYIYIQHIYIYIKTSLPLSLIYGIFSSEPSLIAIFMVSHWSNLRWDAHHW